MYWIATRAYRERTHSLALRIIPSFNKRRCLKRFGVDEALLAPDLVEHLHMSAASLSGILAPCFFPSLDHRAASYSSHANPQIPPGRTLKSSAPSLLILASPGSKLSWSAPDTHAV